MDENNKRKIMIKILTALLSLSLIGNIALGINYTDSQKRISELQELNTQRYHEGHDSGYSKGYNEGYDEGWSDGAHEQRQQDQEWVDANFGTSGDYAETTVYVTNTGTKYHRYGCQYLRQSCIEKTLSEAQAEGYGACSVCW